MTLLLNLPPTAGVVSVSPKRGVALSALFAIQTASWTDDLNDFPLSYSMSSTTQTSKLPVILKPLGVETAIDAYLGQGIPERGYVVICIVTAYDIYGSSGEASTSVEVSP